VKTIKLFQPIAARPARIFRALTDTTDLAAWHADVVRGTVEEGRTLELEWPQLGAQLSLEVRQVVPGRKLVMASSLGNLELSVENGGLELRHTSTFDQDRAEGTESSWRITLAMLSNYLSRHVDRKRRVHWSVTRAETNPALCHAYFTEAPLLRSWLGQVEASMGPVESSVNWTLAGRPARGPVLANTPGRDVAVRWREADDSVLVMRTLPTPDDPNARYLLIGWSRWSDLPHAREVEQELDAAVTRLGKRLQSVARA
jgi:uncharacterized protein YndB with AHSA1/START domain